MSPVRLAPATSGLSRFDDLAANVSGEAISSLSPAGYNGGLTASAARQITRFFGSVSSRMSCSSIS